MAPSALRTALMTGPGPDGGGSKNSISRPHWPGRPARGEPLSVAIAGVTNAAEKMNAIVLAENRRGERSTTAEKRCLLPHRAGTAALDNDRPARGAMDARSSTQRSSPHPR